MLRRIPSSALRCYATAARIPTNEPQLPRYLRRQGKQTNTPPEADKVYRSRHYNPTTPEQDKSNMRLLEPYTLAKRLKKLCDENKIDAAVEMLKNSPRDAQNTQVWNTLIWECMKVKRFTLSYKLYTDMKRRGFSSTSRTFQTMFTGLSKMENWTSHPKQLEHCRLLYDYYQRYMASVRKHDPESEELTSRPLVGYIKILGDNGLYQDIFDVYYALPPTGRGSPDESIYAAMFQALASTPTNAHAAPLHLQNASDARLLWTLMQKALEKSPSLKVDAYVVTPAIAALSRGKDADTDLAFSLVQQYFGLTAPGEPPSKGSFPLTTQSLDTILRLCNTSKKHSLCTHFLEQVKRRSSAQGGKELLDHAHLNEVLKAHMASPDSNAADCLETLEWMLREEILSTDGFKLRPTLVSYHLTLSACWQDADWRTATRVFHLMSGYHSHDFMDGSMSPSPRRDNRTPGRNLDPTPETLNFLVRTAIATRSRADVRQALRIVDYLKVDELFDLTQFKKSHKAKAYFTNKLASAVVEAVQYVEKRSKGPESERWKSIATAASEFEKRVYAEKSDFIPMSG
ncbi:hypothetical protein H0H92_000851 [Tricholoma furcatifolium]|nr:hypothetical protein H0H92_000851 [Tricholoma furcatifolium]